VPWHAFARPHPMNSIARASGQSQSTSGCSLFGPLDAATIGLLDARESSDCRLQAAESRLPAIFGPGANARV